MAEVEIAPLSDRLAEHEIAELSSALERVGATATAESEDGATPPVGDGVDEDALTELMDRLEAHDLACEIYLPVEFEGRVEVGRLRVGSAQSLLEALEDMKDEFELDDDEEDEDEDDGGDEEYGDAILARELRHCWQVLYAGAQTALERHLPLHVQG